MKKLSRMIKLLAVTLTFSVCFLQMAPGPAWAVDVVGVASTDQATFTAGEALPNGTVVYLKGSDRGH